MNLRQFINNLTSTNSAPTDSLYTFRFFMVCIGSFLFFVSFNMLIPELPSYLSKMGGESYKGFIIALFTVTAGLSRPFTGKLTDTIGRVPIMVTGTVFCMVCSSLYPFAEVVLGFLMLRLLHGFSTGFTPTGTTAYLADISAPHKRGEALSIQSFFSHLGMAVAPFSGSWIAQTYSLPALFGVSAVIAFIAFLMLGSMPETLHNKQRFTWKMLRISKTDLFEPHVLQPAVITLLTLYAFGVILTLIPDFSVSLGIANKGIFYVYYTLASLLSRLFGGRVSDIYGRKVVVKIGIIGMIVGLCVIAYANKPATLFLGAVVYGLGSGLNTPALFAWAIDRSSHLYRGRALATIYIFLETGIGSGAFLAGWLLNQTHQFAPAFISAAFASVLALFIAFVPEKSSFNSI
ncbi:MAG: MFS transporter [Cytophagales bacterium]|nr:MFS transporter [Cytophagales bacterium]MDW8383618.1 MFS transporter [Flammeovirgaceae bacterium]